MSERNLLPAERGTRHFFGKPYHWTRTEAGALSLVAGVEPDEDEVSA